MNYKFLLLTIIVFILIFYVGHFMHKNKNGSTIITKAIFEFPKLKGAYGVGTTKRHIIDTARQEPNNVSAHRELMMYFWYPAHVDKNSLTAFYSKKDSEEVKTSLKKKGYPENDLTQLDTIFSHSVENAPTILNHTPFPIVLFSHGYLGTGATSYTHIFEELASHGYIVVSIAHTYFGSKVEFPDGRIIFPQPEKYTQETMPTSAEQDLWVADAQCVLDELKKINQNKNDRFYNYFDLNRVGAFGHSFGGLTAFYLCMKDERVKAGINLDQTPYLDNNIMVSDMKKPFMFIMTECFNQSDEELAKSYQCSVEAIKENRKKNQRVFEIMEKNNAEITNPKSKNLSYKIVPQLLHNGFTDILILKELPLYKNNKNILDMEAMAGSAPGFSTTERINEYIVDFFDKYI